MNVCKTRLCGKLIQLSLGGVLLMAGIFAQGEVSATQAVVRAPALAAEFSVLPKAGPTWQRPAPLTWSSRLNVRLEARWGGDGRYIA